MGHQDVTREFAGEMTRWLGASALAHAALCAGVLSLALRAGDTQEAVLTVALITVPPAAPDAVLPPPTAAPAPRTPARPASLGSKRAPAPTSAPRAPEGGGPRGGNARPAGVDGGAARPVMEAPAGVNGPHAANAPPQPPVHDLALQLLSSPSPPAVASPSPPVDGSGRPNLEDVGTWEARLPSLFAATSPGGGGSSHAGSGSGREGGRALGDLAGSGNGRSGPGSGAGGGTSSGPASAADLLGEIRRRIEAAKRYPEEALRRGIVGRVVVRFRVGADGKVEAAEVRGSSGSQLLDEASLQTVRRAAPFPPVRGWVQVPIAYSLSEGNR